MKITNKLNLPQPLVEMAASDYTSAPNEYRVTSLLKGVREAVLEKRHGDEVEQDISDMIWLIFGTAVHSVLENSKEADHQIKEARLKETIAGLTISGKFDLYDSKKEMVTDYKTASVWKIIFGDFTDWRRQTLIYCYLLRKAGFPAKRGEIVAMLKDHSKRDAKQKSEYPQLPVKVIHFEFSEKDFEDIENWLIGKAVEIQSLETVADDDLPLCSPEERFNSGDKFAVMKKGRKTALRVLDSRKLAEEWMKDGGGDYIDVRPGEDKKCIDYCSVCQFCSHWKLKYGGEFNESDISDT